MGDVFTYFGREPSATIQDLMELGEGAERSRIKQVGVQLSEHLWGFGAPPDPAAEAPAGEAIGKFLRAIRNEFSWVVVDASVDYSDSALVCFDLSDTICLVTGLDVVGVKHLSKSLDTLLTIGLPRERFRVVLNRADSKVGLDASDVERVMKINVDAMIPSSRLVPTSLNKGRPVVLDEPNSEVAQAVRQLAVRFAGQAEMVAAGEAGIDTNKKKKRASCSAAKPKSDGIGRGGTPCPWQTGCRRPNRRTGSPRSASGCRSAWSRASDPACTTRPCPTPSSRAWSTSASASSSTRRRGRSPRRRSS